MLHHPNNMESVGQAKHKYVTETQLIQTVLKRNQYVVGRYYSISRHKTWICTDCLWMCTLSGTPDFTPTSPLTISQAIDWLSIANLILTKLMDANIIHISCFSEMNCSRKKTLQRINPVFSIHVMQYMTFKFYIIRKKMSE